MDNMQEGQPSIIGQVNPQTHVSILHRQADILQTIHRVLSNTYTLEQSLSKVIDTIIDKLEAAKVQKMI